MVILLPAADCRVPVLFMEPRVATSMVPPVTVPLLFSVPAPTLWIPPWLVMEPVRFRTAEPVYNVPTTVPPFQVVAPPAPEVREAPLASVTPENEDPLLVIAPCSVPPETVAELIDKVPV